MNANLNQYEKTEKFLGTKLFDLIPTIKTVVWTEGKVCYDTLITLQNDKTILGEIKVRNIKIDDYNDYILEVSKLVSLINKSKKIKSDKIYYINFFPNKVEGIKDFIVFDLSPRIKDWKINKPKVIQKYMNKVTYLSTDDKILKEVIMLQYDPSLDLRGLISIN